MKKIYASLLFVFIAVFAANAQTTYTHTDKENGFSVIVPKGFEAQDSEGSVKFKAVYPYKGTNVANFNVTTEEVSGYTLDTYVSSSLKSVKEEFASQIKIKKEKKTAFGGYNGYVVVYDFMLDGGDHLSITQYITYVDGKGYILTLTTYKETVKIYKDLFKIIAESFKVL